MCTLVITNVINLSYDKNNNALCFLCFHYPIIQNNTAPHEVKLGKYFYDPFI